MKEALKSLALLLLTGLLITLVITLWFEPSQFVPENDVQQPNTTIDDVSYLIDIESVSMTTENDQIKTFFYDVDGVYQQFKPWLAQQLLNLNDAIPIDAQVFARQRNAISVQFTFRPELTSDVLISVLNNSDILFTPMLTHIRSVIVDERGDVYIYGDGAYYQLRATTKPQSITDVVTAAALEQATTYSTIYQQFGLGDPARLSMQAYFPTGVTAGFKPISVSLETTADQANSILAIADRVFGNRLNFVKRFVDVNHSVVMLYGYGEQALKVSVDGGLIISQKAEQASFRPINLMHDLKLAVNYMEQISGGEADIYLKAATVDNSQAIASVQFDFGYKINGYSVYDQSELAGVQVTVSGGQVSQLKRQVKRFATAVADVVPDQTLPLYAIFKDEDNYNMITADYRAIHADFNGDETSLTDLFNSIDNFGLVYFDRGKLLLPSYRLDVANVRYYFDANNYSLIEREAN